MRLPFTVCSLPTRQTRVNNTMKCNVVTNPNVDGAQPKYTRVTQCEVFNVGGPEWFKEDGSSKTLDTSDLGGPAALSISAVLGSSHGITKDTTYEDFQPCSSKGDCDATTGTCTCNSGPFGAACEKQSTYY